MTEENDSKVIQGPWPKSGRKVKIPDDNSMQLQDDIEFAEELTQSLMVHEISGSLSSSIKFASSTMVLKSTSVSNVSPDSS